MGSSNPPGLGMPRLMDFYCHWVLFDASLILMFIWSWFMVLWWLLSFMCINFWLQEVQRNILPPWRLQWTMYFLWLIWGCWANSWVSKLLNPNMESKFISPSMIQICSTSSMKDFKPSKTPFLLGVKLKEASSSPLVNNTL